jgi:flagellin-like hook-associated protein FlgL
MGASDARLQIAAENNDAARIPIAEGRARIADINIAEEAAAFVRNQILQDESTALEAQSKNLQSSIALKLLS